MAIKVENYKGWKIESFMTYKATKDDGTELVVIEKEEIIKEMIDKLE